MNTSPTELYVCREEPDRSNPRARDRFAVRQNVQAGREVAVITLTGHRVGEEWSPEQWATLFAAAPHLLTAAVDALALLTDANLKEDGSDVTKRLDDAIAQAIGVAA